MTLAIIGYLVFGACFGLATFTRRHLFSEGPTTRVDAKSGDFANGRLMWVLICTFLWPVMALTGLHTAWLLARRRAAARRAAGD
jgi:hypothetical protein